MKKTLALIPLLFCGLTVSAQETVLTLGETDGWTSLSILENLDTVPGRRGFQDLRLATGGYRPDEDTDLLISFDDGRIFDKASRYEPINRDAGTTAKLKVLGSGSGVFEPPASGLILKPKSQKALFQSGRISGDFTIEFWLNPARLTEKSEIFSWKGTRVIRGRAFPVSVQCSLEDRRLTWTFTNFFVPGDLSPRTFTVSETTRLTPETWKHHTLRYKANLGRLELLLNGVTDGIIHTTPSGQEETRVYQAETGNGAGSPIIIGKDLTGYLDEFRISRKWVETPFTGTFGGDRGTAVTSVLELNTVGTRLKKIDTDYLAPENSELFFYYRTTDSRDRKALWDTESLTDWDPDRTSWTALSPGKALSLTAPIRYIQILVDFFPDGTRTLSPTLSKIIISHQKELPPLPPRQIRVRPGNRSLRISWAPSTEWTHPEYIVSFGTAPGIYKGTSDEGPSPIVVTAGAALTLRGLANGELYFLTVQTRDGDNPRNISAFSKESSVRPNRQAGELP